MDKKLTTEEFIKKAQLIHGDQYDYTLVRYVNARTKVSVICPIHGKFEQTPSSHLNGSGCPLCGSVKGAAKKSKLAKEEFILKASLIHKGKGYLYEKVKYVNALTKVTVICPRHGEFNQLPNHHLSGKGCPSCSHMKKTVISAKEFAQRASQVHNNKYTYDKSVYENSRTKLTIVCPKHGDFLQAPNNHLKGRGCSKCSGRK
jgi:Zn finger protein HypA/HybF involved in hydrogenase expression